MDTRPLLEWTDLGACPINPSTFPQRHYFYAKTFFHMFRDNVMTWKFFAYYWPFVRGIHRWTEGSASQRVINDVVNLNNPDSKVHGTNMGPIWGRQDPGGPHVLCYLGRCWTNCQVDTSFRCHDSHVTLLWCHVMKLQPAPPTNQTLWHGAPFTNMD